MCDTTGHDVTAMDELLSGSGGEGSAGVGGRREGGAGGLNDYYSDGTGSVDDDAALASVAGLFAGASAGVGGEAQQASMQSKRSALHVIRQQNRCVVWSCGLCLPSPFPRILTWCACVYVWQAGIAGLAQVAARAVVASPRSCDVLSSDHHGET